MQWTGEAFILSVKKYAESSAIVTVLTAEHGMSKGLARGVFGKKSQGVYMQGNFVTSVWKSRLSEFLGSITCELISPVPANFLFDPLRLAALSSICALMEKTLSEKERQPHLFELIKILFEKLMHDDNWQPYYVRVEVELLSLLGFGLDLSVCASTGQKEDLVYVSPRSGRAVSAEAGEPYKSKLLPLPYFLTVDNDDVVALAEVNKGLALCSYFLDKFIFMEHNIQPCKERIRFISHMKEAEKKAA